MMAGDENRVVVQFYSDDVAERKALCFAFRMVVSQQMPLLKMLPHEVRVNSRKQGRRVFTLNMLYTDWHLTVNAVEERVEVVQFLL